MKERMLDDLKKTFRPEFLNRIDEVIVFHALDKEHTRKIVDLMLDKVTARLAEKDIHIEVTERRPGLPGAGGLRPALRRPAAAQGHTAHRGGQPVGGNIDR